MEAQLEVKGKRINLGAGNVKFSDDAIKKLNYLLGGLFMLTAILYFVNFLEKGFEVGRHFFTSGIYFFAGLLFFFKAHFELSPTSKYAPHFIISETGLKIKTGVFKKPEFIDWGDVKKIELGYYKIGIKDRTGLQYFPYRSRKETSIEIKREIEDIASQKGIEVENLLKR
ncbi:MAG: hypothetical protein ACQETL_02240 [Bacteroidota bacterium]